MLYGEEEFQSLYVPGDNHPTLKGNKTLDSHYFFVSVNPSNQSLIKPNLDQTIILFYHVNVNSKIMLMFHCSLGKLPICLCALLNYLWTPL